MNRLHEKIGPAAQQHRNEELERRVDEVMRHYDLLQLREDLTYIRARLMINRRTSSPRRANEFFYRLRRKGERCLFTSETMADIFPDFHDTFLAGIIEMAVELSLVKRFYICGEKVYWDLAGVMQDNQDLSDMVVFYRLTEGD